MDNPHVSELKSGDLNAIAKFLKISVDHVEATTKLLDAENTIPFIAKYRRDQTGGLYESQIRRIKELSNRFRALNERKVVIRKSIENQGALTDELDNRIQTALTSRELEDIYLPFKPQKQTQAEIARQRGLEPLARDLLEATVSGEDLPSRAAQFIRVDKGLESIDSVIEGVHHLLVEAFSQNVPVRQVIREKIQHSGILTCKLIETPQNNRDQGTTAKNSSVAPTETGSAKDSSTATELPVDVQQESPSPPELSDTHTPLEGPAAETGSAAQVVEIDTPSPVESEPVDQVNDDASVECVGALAGVEDTESQADLSVKLSSESSASPKKRPKKKKEPKQETPFAEFANFRERVKTAAPHRVLAINRGERAGKLKVAIESPDFSIDALVNEYMVADTHPFKDVLAKAARDSLIKTIIPAVEREIRRDVTESAESHAVRVFAKNLRQLLIQRPIAPQVIMAIDPGFRTGCKVALIDATGKPIQTARFSIVGKPERLQEGRNTLIQLVNECAVTLIVLGNGSGCRVVEKLVSELLTNELKDSNVRYSMVNQAGASAYATSELAREELPDYDPVFRSAISIGRRALDPLSELVKINPSNIGVGMYQHDIRAKHLQDSLEAEIESGVNFVGVNLNTASVTLLRHVAGLNQMKARRIVEHRNEHGPFKNRQQLLDVQGIGEKTFVQCAGFLRIFDGDQPLDATPIHPESYEVVEKILAKVGSNPQALIDAANQYSAQSHADHPENSKSSQWQAIRKKVRELDLQKVADELNVGKLLVDDIVRCLLRPTRDPRDEFQPPVQRRSILSVDELEVNMELRGQIVNVVDFGVFVDIGLGTSSLIHVSQLSDKFIHDLHLAFSIGDVLTIWVTEIDKNKKQVKLTAVRPKELPPPQRPFAREQKTYERKPRAQQTRKDKPKFEKKTKKKPSPPPTPITQEMVEGKKPMRSFSDLMQYFDKRGN